MAKRIVKIFSQDSYAGGGTFFNNGLYRIEKSEFVKYNFGKEGGTDWTCLMQELQPVDKDGKDSGDAKVQYWSVGPTEEWIPANKGKSLEAVGERDTIWNLSDFGQLHASWGKAGLDVQALEDDNDVSSLEGQVMEYSVVPNARTKKAVAADDEEGGKKKNFPAQIVVVTDARPLGKGSSGNNKAKAAAANSKEAKSEEGGDDELLRNFLTEKVLISKNEGGVDIMTARMGLKKYVESKGGDADKTKALSALLKDEKYMNKILGPLDWAMKDDEITYIG